MSIKNILSFFCAEPLAMLPAKMLEVRAFLQARADGSRVSEEDIERIEQHKRSREAALFATVQAVDVSAARRGDGIIMSGRVAVMPIFGILSQRVGSLERSSGGISTEEIGATLDGLVNDKQVRAIAMVFDSPGGAVSGLKELGDKIRAARDQKKIVGIADPMAASAGYWLLAQTGEVWVSESGQVGSVGIIKAHEDMSKMEEAMGVKTTLVTSSPYKAEASPFGPLSPEALQELQSKVNAYHAMFVEALAKGRGVTENRVEKGFGQGRMMMADQAKAAGMVDRIGSLGDAVRRLGGEFNTTAEAEVPAIVAETPKVLPRAAVAARLRALELSGK